MPILYSSVNGRELPAVIHGDIFYSVVDDDSLLTEVKLGQTTIVSKPFFDWVKAFKKESASIDSCPVSKPWTIVTSPNPTTILLESEQHKSTLRFNIDRNGNVNNLNVYNRVT